MVQYAINTTQGASMSFFGISQALQRELEKTFSEEMCNVLIKLVEEIYATSDVRFHKIFEEKQEFLVLSISERLREVFATKSELKVAIEQLKLVVEAEFAKVRQEMAELRAELKQDIAEVRQEMAEMKSELKQDIAEVRQEMAEMKSELKQEMADMKLELKQDISEVKTDLLKWFVGSQIALGGLIVAALKLL